MENGTFAQGDVLILKKQHPCGGCAWKVARMGADVKLQCVTCGKYVTLTREQIRKSLKSKKETTL